MVSPASDGVGASLAAGDLPHKPGARDRRTGTELRVSWMRARPALLHSVSSSNQRSLPMTSEAIRDPLRDPLLTPQNSALVVIDYQPSQVQAVKSMDQELLVRNIVSVARTAATFGLPVILSTVNVANGQGHTVP